MIIFLSKPFDKKLQAEKNYSNAYEKGNTEGYTKGMNDWAIWVYCLKCGEAVYIAPNSDAHMAIIEFLKERGWDHPEYPEE